MASLLSAIITMLLACSASPVAAHLEITGDVDHQLGRLFWAVFVLSVVGFFIYLFCTYPASEPPPPRQTRQPEESVVNVRLLNLPDLLKLLRPNNSDGRPFSSQSYPPA